VAEFLAAAWLLHHLNAYVAIPPDPNDTDLLLQTEDGKWLSIQVKMTFVHDDELVANVSKSNGQSYETDYILIVFPPDECCGDRYYLIPTNKIREKSRVMLRNYESYRKDFNQAPVL